MIVWRQVFGWLRRKHPTSGWKDLRWRYCDGGWWPRDGDVVLFGREEILAIATPGHTPGSISYLWRDRVFTGDTLLIGGCGRTDFQNGSAVALYRSITGKLFKLDAQVHVEETRKPSSVDNRTTG